LEDLANDAVAGVEFLKGHDWIDPNRIGIFGVSQGGWIAPLAASKSEYVALVECLLKVMRKIKDEHGGRFALKLIPALK